MIDMKKEDESFGGKRFTHSYNFLGFTLFDVFYILFAIVSIVFSLLERRFNFEMTIAFEILDVIFAIILIGFVDRLAKEEDRDEEKNRHYNFAWIVASAAILAPQSIRIAYVLSDEFNRITTLYLARLILCVLAFLTFSACLFIRRGSKAWYITMFVGMTLVVAAIPFALMETIIQQEGVHLILESVGAFVPLLPVGFGVFSFFKDEEARFYLSRKK
jgi:hypothetical protein